MSNRRFRRASRPIKPMARAAICTALVIAAGCGVGIGYLNSLMQNSHTEIKITENASIALPSKVVAESALLVIQLASPGRYSPINKPNAAESAHADGEKRLYYRKRRDEII